MPIKNHQPERSFIKLKSVFSFSLSLSVSFAEKAGYQSPYAMDNGVVSGKRRRMRRVS